MSTRPQVDFVIGNARHHTAAVLPVVSRLHERNSVDCRILSLCELRGQETPTARLRDAGAEVVQLVPRAPKKEGTAGAARSAVPAESRARKVVQAIAWHALVLWNRAKSQEPPSVAVLPNDVAFPYDRVLQRFQRDGVRTVLLQEGIRFELPAEQEGKRFGQGGVDMVAAWGPSAARYFERVGVAPSHIRLTGNPRLDALKFNADSDEDGEADFERPYILCVSNSVADQGYCTPAEQYEYFSRFIRGVKEFLEKSGYHLVVKLHTGEDFSPYDRIVRECGVPGDISLVQKKPIYPLIRNSEAVLILTSTVGLEAMLLERPVGLLPIPHLGHIGQYLESKAALPLHLDNRLVGELHTLVEDGSDMRFRRQQFLSDHVSNFGCAVGAVADLITELAHEGDE